MLDIRGTYDSLHYGDGQLQAWSAVTVDVLESEQCVFVSQAGLIIKLTRRIDGEKTPLR